MAFRLIGMDLVSKSKPDGYTLVAAQGGNMTALPHTTKIVTYNPLKRFLFDCCIYL